MLDFQSKLTDLKSAHACLVSKIMNHSGGHVASIEPVENCKKNEKKQEEVIPARKKEQFEIN